MAICLSFSTPPGLMGTARIEGSLRGKGGWGRDTYQTKYHPGDER